MPTTTDPTASKANHDVGIIAAAAFLVLGSRLWYEIREETARRQGDEKRCARDDSTAGGHLK
jgi:hypothetical protein